MCRLSSHSLLWVYFYSFLMDRYSSVPSGRPVPLSKREIRPFRVFSISSVVEGTTKLSSAFIY